MKKKIVSYFVKNYKDLYIKMQATSHHGENYYSIFHEEGSVWAHTVMVLNELDKDSSNNLILAALLHDIGKIYTRIIKEDDSVHFYGHEGRSTLEAIDIVKDFNNNVCNVDIIEVLKLINYHHIFFNVINNKKNDISKNSIIKLADKLFKFDDMFFNDLKKLTIADNNGRKTENKSTSDLLYVINEVHNLIDYKRNIENVTHNTSPEIIILVGIPYSGKSFFIKNNNFENYNIISRDDIISDMYPENSYNENFTKINHDEVDEILYNKIKDSVNNKDNIIIDMTNTSRKSRNRKLQYVTKSYKKRAIVFLTSLEEIEKRRKKRTIKYIPKKNMDIMITNFKIPYGDEVDQIDFIIYDRWK